MAPWAIATQHEYGVPAAVTIAQAIDESGWGRSELAALYHNLFGMKGAGPAGSIDLPTQEFEHGRLVARISAFRVYHDIEQSVEDHARLLATSGYYQQAMADREDPNAFAAALTGVYATDPGYGAKLIRLMRRYDLYRYDLTKQRGGGRPSPLSAAPARPASARGSAAPAPTVSTEPLGSGPLGSGPLAPGPLAPEPAAAPTPGASPRPESAQAAHPTAARPALAPTAPPSAHPAPAPSAGASAGPDPAPPASGTPRPSGAAAEAVSAAMMTGAAEWVVAAVPRRRERAGAGKYQRQIPPSVRDVFFSTARGPLLRAEPLYRDVASHRGIGWELLAACDWMQCEARPRFSPVHGERLGTANPDGTVYRTKSQALEQCADDLADLAWAVYRIDLTTPSRLSVRDLANVFAAFRWGALLKRHHISGMEFPYAVEGLTAQHIGMRWPDIAERDVPDRPGSRFRRHFGAVPIVLQLNYPATI